MGVGVGTIGQAGPAGRDTAAIRVSVIVPTYNPGRYLDRCLVSLLGQTLPQHQYEVIVVDDGSTDETEALLDTVAVRHPQLRVLHRPASGWSPEPRNRGIAAAAGEYVFFCDADGWLATDALERLYGYAEAHDSDIVVGKIVGLGRPVPSELFRRSRPTAGVADAPLMDSLTAHALFRRSLLETHGIRFPEQRRQLEDQLFVVQAYLAARRIGVYADSSCYFHLDRPPRDGRTSGPTDWTDYYANVAEVIDHVERHTVPGSLRDRVLSRWLRVETVARLTGTALLRRSPEDVAAQLSAATPLARDHFGPGVVACLPVFDRPVGRAVIDGDLSAVRARAEEVARWSVRASITCATWCAQGLHLSGTVDLSQGDRAGGQALTDPFAQLFPDLAEREVRTLLNSSAPTLELQNPATGERLALPAQFTGLGRRRGFIATIDPTRLAGGGKPAAWQLFCEFGVLGFRRRVRVRAGLSALPATLNHTRGRVSVEVSVGADQKLWLIASTSAEATTLPAQAWRFLRSRRPVRHLARVARRQQA